MSIKPEMQLAGMYGNIFNILGAASKLLKENGIETQAKEMFERTTAATSYDNALLIISEYVQTELLELEQESIQQDKYDVRGFERLYTTILRDESMPKSGLEQTLYKWYFALPDGGRNILNEADFVSTLKNSSEPPYASLAQACRSIHFLRQELQEIIYGHSYWNEYHQSDELYHTYAREYRERFNTHVTSSFSNWKLCEASLYPNVEISAELDYSYINRLNSTGPKQIYICAPLRILPLKAFIAAETIKTWTKMVERSIGKRAKRKNLKDLGR